MPALKPKALQDYPDEISKPWIEAIRVPGVRVIVAEGVSETRAKYLHARLKAARQGMREFYDRDHPYYRAAAYDRLQIRKERYPLNQELWDVRVWFTGLIKRPSEEAAEAYAILMRNRARYDE
jgi:hypothetical protein